MMKVAARIAVFVVTAMLVIGGAASAQVTSGTVTGTIKDAQGGVMPGVTVVLESETKGTKSTPAVTSASGDFVFPNVTADVYTVDVTMSGFKTMRRSGVTVGAGNRVGLGVLVLEVGGLDQTIEVRAEAPLIQAQSGERSFTVPTDQVANLPIANRSFTALTQLAPGVQGTNRIGGGGGNNIMIDGVSAVDTGSNSILLQMNVESIAEVKVLTSGYQAEYGRSSGLQVTAVTKSGTNRFHGSLYDVERNSSWNANSRTNALNGDAKTVLKERDLGYSLGGPVGRAGGNNKLFFFYSHEYAPRKAGGTINRFRVPTALERQGDFSQSGVTVYDPFSTRLQVASARPVARIKYVREAYEYRHGSPVRITMDTDLECAVTLAPSFLHGGTDWVTTPLEGVVLEIKFTERFPDWVQGIVDRMNLQQVSIPKYVLCLDHLFTCGGSAVTSLAGFCLPPHWA